MTTTRLKSPGYMTKVRLPMMHRSNGLEPLGRLESHPSRRVFLDSWIALVWYGGFWDCGIPKSPWGSTLQSFNLDDSFGWKQWIFWFFFAAGFGFFCGFLVLCFPVSLIFCFSASLLFCFSAFCFPCFSAFPASLLFAFAASLLFCFSVFPASLLLYFCAFLLLLFYLFFSSVMCFCCSTSRFFASLLPVFTVSLFFIFFCFILFCLYPKWSPRETLGETQRNPKEILIRNPTWKP